MKNNFRLTNVEKLVLFAEDDGSIVIDFYTEQNDILDQIDRDYIKEQCEFVEVEDIEEQYDIVEELQGEIEELKERIRELESEIDD